FTPRVALSINRLVDLFHFSQFILAHGPDDVSPIEAVRPGHAELVHDFYVRGHRPQVRSHQSLDVLLDKVPDLIRRNIKYASYLRPSLRLQCIHRRPTKPWAEDTAGSLFRRLTCVPREIGPPRPQINVVRSARAKGFVYVRLTFPQLFQSPCDMLLYRSRVQLFRLLRQPLRPKCPPGQDV